MRPWMKLATNHIGVVQPQVADKKWDAMRPIFLLPPMIGFTKSVSAFSYGPALNTANDCAG
jgi:hypothetical protein